MRTRSFFAVLFIVVLSTSAASAQWAPVASGATKTLHAVKLLDSGVGYAVGESGTIVKTTDGGATWSALVSGSTRALYGVSVLNDSEAIAVGDSGLILRTTNGGADWRTISSGVRDSLRSVSFNGSNGICGGLSQDILYSADAGATWHLSQKGFFGGGFFGAQMLSPTLGFVAGQNSIFQALLGVTTDGGVTWQFQPFYFNGNEGSCNDVFFFDGTTGLTSGALFDFTGAIARTTDGAFDWDSTIFPTPLEGIDFPLATTGGVVGLGGTILNSTNAGVSFTAQTSGTSADLYDVSFASDGQTGIAVGDSGTILRTTNGGAAGGLALVAAASSKRGFAIDLPLAGAPGIESRLASDRYLTIESTFSGPISAVDPTGDASCGRLGNVRVDPQNPQRVLASYLSDGCNGQTVTCTIHNLQADGGEALADANVPLSLLLGDVTGDGMVDDADYQETKLHVGELTDDSNLRADLNGDGRIDRTDARLVRRRDGSTLLP